MEIMTISQLALPDTEKGTLFRGFFLLVAREERTSRNGAPFLTLELADRTGRLKAQCFDGSPFFSLFREASNETIWEIEGAVDHFNDRLSPSLRQARLLDPAEAEHHWGEVIEVPPEPIASLRQELLDGISSIRQETLRATVEDVFKELGEAFFEAPAAIGMHHAYRHGLIEHTVHMMRAARALFAVYPEVDTDLALAGILLHDVGKVLEYEGTLSPRRSRVGLLHGHVVLGYRLARKAALKHGLCPHLTERLEHIILSHQGELEWGAAVYAATPEAVFVSMVDNLDARMGMVQMTLRRAAPDSEISDRVVGLKTPLILRDPDDESS